LLYTLLNVLSRLGANASNAEFYIRLYSLLFWFTGHTFSGQGFVGTCLNGWYVWLKLDDV